MGGQAMGTPATTLAVTLTVAIATLHCLEGVTATMCVGGRTSASRTGCTRATGLQSAGPSAISSQSAWEETGTAEAVTASYVDRMEVVEATGTTRATTQATTPDTTRDTIRAVTVDVVECRGEPVEELLLPLMFSSQPGLVRRRRRCRPPTLPWSLNKLTNTGSVSPSQTFFQKQFYGKFSVKYIYLLIK